MSGTREEKGVSSEGKSLGDVRRHWLEHEDGVLAKRLQQQEFEEHSSQNRSKRQAVQRDLPVARCFQKQEEMERQRQQLQRLTHLQAQALEDEAVARRLQAQIQAEERLREDEMVARRLQAQLQEVDRKSRLPRE